MLSNVDSDIILLSSMKGENLLVMEGVLLDGALACATSYGLMWEQLNSDINTKARK